MYKNVRYIDIYEYVRNVSHGMNGHTCKRKRQGARIIANYDECVLSLGINYAQYELYIKIDILFDRSKT